MTRSVALSAAVSYGIAQSGHGALPSSTQIQVRMFSSRSRSASAEEMDHLLELRAAAIDAITAARASAEAQLNVH